MKFKYFHTAKCRSIERDIIFITALKTMNPKCFSLGRSIFVHIHSIRILRTPKTTTRHKDQYLSTQHRSNQRIITLNIEAHGPLNVKTLLRLQLLKEYWDSDRSGMPSSKTTPNYWKSQQ